MGIFTTDRERRILALFGRGDASAMDMLYSEFAPWLTSVCSRYIPEPDDLKDVMQEGFIKIFTSIPSFEYRGKGSLKAWMSRIMVNECLLFLRGRSSSVVTAVDEMPDFPDLEPDAAAVTADVLDSMIKRLPQGYRAVFNLYVVEGKSHKEIARMLGIKADTSASQLHKAKNMLASMINQYKMQNS